MGKKTKTQATTAPATATATAPAPAPSLEEAVSLLKALAATLGAAPTPPTAPATPTPTATATDWAKAKDILQGAVDALGKAGFTALTFQVVLQASPGKQRKFWAHDGKVMDKEDLDPPAPTPTAAPAPKGKKAPSKGAKAKALDKAMAPAVEDLMARAVGRATREWGVEIGEKITRRFRSLRENAPQAIPGYASFILGARWPHDRAIILDGWRDLATRFGGGENKA